MTAMLKDFVSKTVCDRLSGLVIFVVLGVTIQGMAQPFICDANTLALYHFDEASGNTVFDACISGNTGVASGTAIVDGIYGNARQFNGTSDWIGISNLESLGSDEMTIEAYVFVESYPETGGETKYIYKRRGNNADHSLGIWYDGTLSFTLCDGNTCPQINSTCAIPLYRWVHVMGTYDGNTMKVHIDSVPHGSVDVDFAIAWSPLQATDVGRDPDGQSERYFHGVIDELRVSDVDRSPITGIEDPPIAYPSGFKLNQNYPNPFNPNTTIGYSLPEKSTIKLIIYNSLGQEVRTLVNETQRSGNYTVNWDGEDSKGRAVSSGAYIVKMTAGEFSKSITVILQK